MSSISIGIWVIQIIAMMLTALLIPGLTISGPIGALIAVAGLAFVNTQFWDAGLFYSLPTSLTVNTLYLFLTNGIIFWFIVKILPGIQTQGFLPAFIAPVIFTVTSICLNHYLKDVDWKHLTKTDQHYLGETKEAIRDVVPQLKITSTPTQ